MSLLGRIRDLLARLRAWLQRRALRGLPRAREALHALPPAPLALRPPPPARPLARVSMLPPPAALSVFREERFGLAPGTFRSAPTHRLLRHIGRYVARRELLDAWADGDPAAGPLGGEIDAWAPRRAPPPFDPLGVLRPAAFGLHPQTAAPSVETIGPRPRPLPRDPAAKLARILDPPPFGGARLRSMEPTGWIMSVLDEHVAASLPPGPPRPLVDQPEEVSEALRHCREQFILRRNVARDEFADWQPHQIRLDPGASAIEAVDVKALHEEVAAFLAQGQVRIELGLRMEPPLQPLPRKEAAALRAELLAALGTAPAAKG